MPDTTKTTFDLLFAFMQRAKQQWEAVAEQSGLSLAQLHTIWLLKNDDTSMVQLASQLLCDASYVTGIVDRLAEQGLVERRENPRDRRVKLVVLTTQGRKLCATIEKHIRAAEQTLLTHLSPAERIQFQTLLQNAITPHS